MNFILHETVSVCINISVVEFSAERSRRTTFFLKQTEILNNLFSRLFSGVGLSLLQVREETNDPKPKY